MNSWQGINQFLLVYRRAFSAMGRARIWLPFLLYAVVQFAVLGFVYFGVRPPFVDFFRGPLGFAVPGAYFHYPSHFLMLPFVYFRFLIPVGAVGESLLMAAATWIFVRHFRNQALPGLGQALREVRFGFLQFVLFWILGFALLFAWHTAFDWALGDLWAGFARRRMALELAQEAGKVVLNGLLAYSTVIIIVERSSVWGTLSRALRAFGRHLLATVVFVGFSSLLVYPTNYLFQHVGNWIGGFNPEVMLFVVAANIVMGSLSAFLVVAVLTLWYLLPRQSS